MGDPLASDVAGMVRLLARLRRVSGKEIAAVLHLSPGQVSERMTGKVEFRALELAKLAGLLGVHPGDFFEDPARVLRGGWAARGSNPAPEDYKRASGRRHLAVVEGGGKPGTSRSRRPLVAVVES
ncbi:MAG: hypothetical protein AB7H43_14535 [Acidimicrobiia bacterium]